MDTLHNGRRGTNHSGLHLTAERAAEALRSAASMKSSADSFWPVLDLAIRTGKWDAATVSMVVGDGSLETVASSADGAQRADRRHYELGDGPCLVEIGTSALVVVADIALDSRWPDCARSRPISASPPPCRRRCSPTAPSEP